MRYYPYNLVWESPESVSLNIFDRGGRLNIKMSSYQYRDPHVKDKSHYRLIFNMGSAIPGKDGLYIETGPRTLSAAGQRLDTHRYIVIAL